jgi:hypothetical protein
LFTVDLEDLTEEGELTNTKERPLPQMSPDDNHNHRSESSKNPPPDAPSLPPAPAPLSNGKLSNGHCSSPEITSEEEKIREYLGRSDTAVIFPEPVRDLQATAATTANGEYIIPSNFANNITSSAS